MAVEKDIYRLKELSADEANSVLEMFSSGMSPVQQRSNEKWMDLLNWIFKIKTQYQDSNLPEAVADEIERLEFNLCEDIHTAIENVGAPYLESLYLKNLGFFENADDIAKFTFYLMVQYCRTRRMKESLKSFKSFRGFSVDKAWNVIVLMTATNVGMSIFAEREKWELIGIENLTSVPFLTSDQPVVNLYAGPRNEESRSLKADESELYYPLTHKFAVVLKDKASSYLDYKKLSAETIGMLNRKIVEGSELQLFSNSDTCLRVYA